MYLQVKVKLCNWLLSTELLYKLIKIIVLAVEIDNLLRKGYTKWAGVPNLMRIIILHVLNHEICEYVCRQ